MRIALNAVGFAPGRMGGMETYFRNLLFNLQRLEGGDSYSVLCDERHAGEFDLTNSAFGFRYLNYARPSARWLLRGLLRNLLGLDPLSLEMRGVAADLIHHPFTVLTPLGMRIPSVLTFWDMQHEFFPEFFPPLELRKRRRIYRMSAEQATRIIVSSAFTGECLMERYGIDRRRIEVIHTGFGGEYRVIDDREALERVRARYALERPFLFYPAATWPHKNHKTLLAALRILREEYRFDGELLLSGIAMGAHGDILAEIERLGLAGSVRVLGYLPSGELPCIFNLARVMVFPSLFEGFGIPLVEAMACGCPVACSNVTSLPEVAGDAGALFDPHCAEEMAERIWQLWSDDELRATLRRRGLERARLFDWQETARKTVAVYRTAAAEGQP
ncbi:MAG: glycosyltransferase family 4 protein [Deltaproteobacteria bacterium]|nr:glycosyltransferase family 4 protein [Deltaproteobacteria bacterium]